MPVKIVKPIKIAKPIRCNEENDVFSDSSIFAGCDCSNVEKIMAIILNASKKNIAIKLSDVMDALYEIDANEETYNMMFDWLDENVKYIDDLHTSESLEVKEYSFKGYANAMEYYKNYLFPSFKPETLDLLKKHKIKNTDLEMMLCGSMEDYSEKKWCVYDEYTLGDNKTFWIGVTDDINKYRYPRTNSRIIMLEKLKGTGIRKLIDNISYDEAQIFAYCIEDELVETNRMISRGFSHHSSIRNYNEQIIKDDFIEFYFPEIFNDKTNYFDIPNIDSLSDVSFYQESNIETVNSLISIKSSITKNVGKKTKCLIVSGQISYDVLFSLKNKYKIKIVSANEVVNVINNSDIKKDNDAVIKARRSSYDYVVRQFLREFMQKNGDLLERYSMYIDKKRYCYDFWEDPFKSSILKHLDPEEYAGSYCKQVLIDIIKTTVWAKNYPHQLSNFKKLCSLYNKFGLFEEAANILKNNNETAVEYIKELEYVEGDKNKTPENRASEFEDDDGTVFTIYACGRCGAFLNSQERFNQNLNNYVCNCCQKDNILSEL